MVLSTQRLLTGSQTVQTSMGPIEFAITGEGPPVLVIHGAGGGYDQSLSLMKLMNNGYQGIAVSRFGYIGSPLPVDASPASQADAYAALLDTLSIPQVTIIGVSAGGPSTLQFAIRHPERCSGLVMISAVSNRHVFGDNDNRHMQVYRLALKGDFFAWLLVHLLRPILLSFYSVPKDVRAKLSTDQKNWMNEFFESLLPISLKSRGIQNDLFQISQMDCYPLDKIQCRTLVVHARDDLLVPFSQAQFCAENIPSAQLIEIPYGGHLLLGHHQEVGEQVSDFLKKCND